jgi:hypothetical protein
MSVQQPCMSQQASEFWLVFCGGFRVSPAAEIASAAAQAKLIKSILTFLIIVSPNSVTRPITSLYITNPPQGKTKAAER